MDIERVNSLLLKAIMGLQDAELEGMTEASIGGYKIPSPGQVGKKKKGCSHRNKAGDFDSFNDCVKHLTKCKGRKIEDAKGICGGSMFGRRKSGGGDE